jgi:hypothetical protein
MLFSCLAYSSTLKMEAPCFSETSVYFAGLHGVMSQKVELLLDVAVPAGDQTLSFQSVATVSLSSETMVIRISHVLYCVVYLTLL